MLCDLVRIGYIIMDMCQAMSPALRVTDDDDGPSLPVKVNEEFKPFMRRLPEFKFWCVSPLTQQPLTRSSSSGASPRSHSSLSLAVQVLVRLPTHTAATSRSQFKFWCVSPLTQQPLTRSVLVRLPAHTAASHSQFKFWCVSPLTQQPLTRSSSSGASPRSHSSHLSLTVQVLVRLPLTQQPLTRSSSSGVSPRSHSSLSLAVQVLVRLPLTQQPLTRSSSSGVSPRSHSSLSLAVFWCVSPLTQQPLTRSVTPAAIVKYSHTDVHIESTSFTLSSAHLFYRCGTETRLRSTRK